MKASFAARSYAAQCSDSSDNEPLSELVRKTSESGMKQAVVLLERMSERDVMDAVARGHAHSQEQESTAKAGNNRVCLLSMSIPNGVKNDYCIIYAIIFIDVF